MPGWRAAFEGAAEALFLASLDGRYVAVNEAACLITGYTRHELLGITMADLVDREELAERPFAMERMARGEAVRTRRFIRRRDGSRFPAEVAGRRLEDGSFIGCVRDLSEEVRLEAELRASEARYRSLVAACPDAILELDPQMRISYGSPAALELFGAATEAELLGISAEALLAPGQEAAARARFGRRMSGEVLPPQEWQVITLDGRQLLCELNLGVVRDPDARPTAIMTIARDVTARRRAEDQLRHVSRLYSLLSHISMAMVRATDERAFLQQVCEVAVEHGRARMAWIAMLTPDGGAIEQAGAAGADAVPMAERACAMGPADTPRGPLWGALLSGEIEVCNDVPADPRLEGWRPVATEMRVFSGASAPLRRSGRVIGALSIYSSEIGFFSAAETSVLRQITDEISFALNKLAAERERDRVEAERKVLQAQLIQAQKMESVGRLAGGVAHDFNNMLSIILGNLDLAMATLPADSALRPTLEGARDAGRRSAEITRQLLTFARKQAAMPRVLDLNVAVEGALSMLRRLIGEDIELRWEPGRPGARVRIDPTQLDQVLANLAANARDAIGGVGHVVVRTRAVDVTADHGKVPPGPYMVLEMADSGAGMDADTLAHAFEPFFTTKPGELGTGLGLATVHGIVEQNGGAIVVRSSPAEGTTFQIFLPRIDDPLAPPAPATTPPLTRGHGTILIVEDEAALGRVLRVVLTRLGYDVLVATTPAEAMKIFQVDGERVDLLLTDIVMPGMNGRDLAAALTLLSPRLKCLFMSGYLADVIGHGGVLDEGVQLLQKPFSMEELAERVAALLPVV